MKKAQKAQLDQIQESSIAKATEDFSRAVSAMGIALAIQSDRPFGKQKLSARERSFVALAKRDFVKAQKALNEALGLAVPPMKKSVADKRNKTPKLVPIVVVQDDDQWDEVEEQLVKSTEARRLAKVARSGWQAHPKCHFCGSRHCGVDHDRNGHWGRPAKPSKARK